MHVERERRVREAVGALERRAGVGRADAALIFDDDSRRDYYDHDAIPEWKNSLLLGNLKGGNGDIGQRLCNLRLDAAGERVIDYREYFTYTFGRIRDVLVLPDGRVLLCTSNRETNSNAMEVVGPLDDLIIEIKAVR